MYSAWTNELMVGRGAVGMAGPDGYTLGCGDNGLGKGM